MRYLTPKIILSGICALVLAATVILVYLHRLDGYGRLQAGLYAYAARWFETAATGGDLNAQNMLGTLYYHGLGVPQNYEIARIWYAAAAFDGNTSAQINMGIMYRQGFGGELDLRRAYGWFSIANKNGSSLGQIYMSDTLAETPLNGNIVPQILRRYSSLDALRR